MAKLKLELLENRLVPSTVAVPFSIAKPMEDPVIFGFTPQQIRHAYGFDQLFENYDQQAGKGQIITIVDAYLDESFVRNGLTFFDQHFGLPIANLTILNEHGDTLPLPTQSDFGWGIEENLDIEWAHVIAPQASIILVAADTADLTDMMAAVDTAKHIPGVSAVSLSWGAIENASELQYDPVLHDTVNGKNVGIFAASGDDGTQYYPSTNPDVVSIGGSTLFLDDDGNYAGEQGWWNSGGGYSTIYANRPTPDVAYNSNQLPGYPVYEGGVWWQVGGTSAAAPQFAALYSLMLQKNVVTGDINARVLFDSLPASDYHDITLMNQTPGEGGHVVGPGYDLVTGYGTPIVPKFFQSPNQRFVLQLYNQLLDRTPSDQDVGYFVSQLNGGVSTYNVTTIFTNSAEYYHDQVNKVFQDYLGRNAENNAFAGTNLTHEELVVLVSTSSEALAGKSAGEFNFVNNLYVAEMGSPVDPVSYHTLATMLEHGFSPTVISTIVVNSLQHDAYLVTSWYNTFMRRGVDQDGLTYWANLLNNRSITDSGVIDALFGSEEFFLEV